MTEPTKLAEPLRLRIGDFEMVSANPDMLRMLEKCIDQHAKILELNAALIKVFATPPLIRAPGKAND